MRHPNPSKVKVIYFTKLRQWYIPADGASYRLLHSQKLPSIRYHEDFFPTLQLLTQKKNIRAALKPFSEIYDEFITKVISTWEKDPRRRVIVAKESLRFESKDPEKSRTAYPKVEACLRRFYRRWGFKSDFNYSESPTRSKLVVQFAHDRDRLPVIEFME